MATITLFAEDLRATREFYERVFRTELVFEDADSAVYRFDGMLVNLLDTRAVPGLIDPAPLAPPDAGVRFQLTLEVDDVDRECERLRALGLSLLNGPMDRPWGVRTVSFRDPAGHVWELAGSP